MVGDVHAAAVLWMGATEVAVMRWVELLIFGVVVGAGNYQVMMRFPDVSPVAFGVVAGLWVFIERTQRDKRESHKLEVF